MLSGDYARITQDIVEKDKSQFKKLNDNYAEDPVRESKLAIALLWNDQQWKSHWNYFLEQMVYDQNKPTFDKAYAQLQLLSHEIFAVLK